MRIEIILTGLTAPHTSIESRTHLDKYIISDYITFYVFIYFPYLSLLAQLVTIFVYGPARYLHYFR